MTPYKQTMNDPAVQREDAASLSSVPGIRNQKKRRDHDLHQRQLRESRDEANKQHTKTVAWRHRSALSRDVAGSSVEGFATCGGASSSAKNISRTYLYSDAATRSERFRAALKAPCAFRRWLAAISNALGNSERTEHSIFQPVR